MAKPIIQFSAVPYSIGTGSAAKTGYHPVLCAQQAVMDLDFVQEVVTEKRLSMSANELLHAIQMLVEVGLAKVASDGRPRGITGLLKFNRYANGNLDSPTSSWNDTCRAYVKAQLLTAAEDNTIDATFQNVEEGIGVKLDNVTWVGAQSVVNVIKVNEYFCAYGRNMQFISGDSAQLVLSDGTTKTLTCPESDVSHAKFAWPTDWAPEAGTQVTFIMKSRGGVSEGEVYTSTKKNITIIAAS